MTRVEIRTSNHPKPGRRFQPVHELALGEDALRAAQTLPGAHRGSLIVPEMTGPFGIPDFVALVGTGERLRDRLALHTPPLLNEIDAGIVATLFARKGSGLSGIADKLGWPVDTIARRVPGLRGMGAITEIRPGFYIRNPYIQPLGKIYAIESKVRDWRRALQQGRLYQTWADNYVLVLGAVGNVAVEKATDAARIDGAGIVVGARWILRPSARTLPAARRLWALEHMVAALRDHQPSSVR